MTTNYRTAVLDVPIEPFVDEAELAAVAFLARYSGRTRRLPPRSAQPVPVVG